MSITLTGTIDPAATGSLTNTAHVSPPAGVTDPDPADNNATDTDTLTPQADLSITKTDGQTSAVPGTPTTYTIVVTNDGPSTVTGADRDRHLAGRPSPAPTWSAPPSGRHATTRPRGTVRPALSAWPPAAAVTITLTGTIDPAATGSLTNTATVSPPAGVTDPDPANNSATDTDTLTPQADLSVTKTDGVTSAVPGTQNTYTIVVSNHGPSAVSGASVSDPLPAGVTAATWTATASSGGGTVTGPLSGTGALATTVDLPVNASVTFTFTVLVSPSATGSPEPTRPRSARPPG